MSFIGRVAGAILAIDRYPTEEDWIMATRSVSVRAGRPATTTSPAAPLAVPAATDTTAAAPPAIDTTVAAPAAIDTSALTIGIVGAGRVGSALGGALAGTGHRITGASGRSDATRSRIASLPGAVRRRPVDVVRNADLVIVAVPDDVLAPLIADLGESGAFRPGVIVAHTSGAHGIGILHPATARGALPLALHPAMTFTGADADVGLLTSGITFGVTAPDELRAVAMDLVAELGGAIEWIDDSHRALYHTALAHGANHLVTLVNEALDRLRDAGVVHPEQVLSPLLHAALDNALAMGDAALTGPVSRGDANTVARHLDTLDEYAPDSVPVYLELARRTADRAISAGRISPSAAAPLLGVLARRPAER
jgi:predicted short-subunit dehydrogenase-like oxidoreductase (DUF2520 family)